MTPVPIRTLAAAFVAVAVSFAAPPAPESFFGHAMGADRSSLEWKRVVEYFHELEKGSDRLRVLEYGRSEEGRPMVAAIITAPSTLRRLEHFRQNQKSLIDARQTPVAEAGKLIAEGKTVVLITCSVHATEVASTHTAVEFAHRLATSTDSKTREILENVILILAPSINPDGLDLVTNWYRRTLGTPYEGTSPPELYQKYTGHDNNRDWYIFTQSETRAVVSGLHNQWHPQIVYDVHQMGPRAARIWVPPYLDPIEPNVDPLIAQGANMVGMTMAADLTAAGRKGVAVNAMYDLWTPARHYQSYHGGMRILSESASVRIASPVRLTAEELSATALGYSPRERAWNHLEPWPGGEWKLRDIVDDQLIAMESVCVQAAQRREFFLRNFYNFSRNAISRGTPQMFILSSKQADPGAAAKLLETLRFGAIEIEKATSPFTAAGRDFDAGSYMIRMSQPFSGFAKALLERQDYPDLRMYPGGPPKRPYDVTAHTLPLLMGVDVVPAATAPTVASTRVDAFEFSPVSPPAANILPASDSTSWRRVNEAWKSGRSVWRSAATGDFAIAQRRPSGMAELRKPRVALYRGFQPSMDEGWTRWILEHFGWDYSSARNADLTASNLLAKYDVIVFADQSADSIHEGYRQGSMPEEYIGGLGTAGAAALKQFVQDGGRLVFLNRSGLYVKDHLGIAAQDVVEKIPSREFYCPGSLLNVKVDASSPLTLGLPSTFTIWMEGSPVWQTQGLRGAVTPLRYPASNVLASGWLLGEKFIAGQAPLVDIPSGKGHVILFGMRPQYRGQSYLALKMLFNALVMDSSRR